MPKPNRAIIRCFFPIFIFFISCSVAAWGSETLRPGEKIHIWVKGEPDLTVDRTIGKDGSISFPLIGSIGLVGLNPRDAAKTIAKMLDDGYLRNPLVQVDRIDTPKMVAGLPKTVVAEPLKFPTEEIQYDPFPAGARGERFGDPIPMESEGGRSTEAPRRSDVAIFPKSPAKVEVVDGKNGKPIPGVAMLLNGKIYQGNRNGQLSLEYREGPMVLMADGYKFVQGNIENHLRNGSRYQIAMEPEIYAPEIVIKIVDFSSNLPMDGVLVTMESMKVKTGSQGTFKIKEIKKEFGEIQFSKRGYRPLRRVLDFKDSSERIIPMMRND